MNIYSAMECGEKVLRMKYNNYCHKLLIIDINHADYYLFCKIFETIFS